MKHNSDHGNLNHDFTCISKIFIVFAETPVSVQPCKRSFNNPSSGQENKAFAFNRACNDFQDKVEIPFQPSGQFSGISSVSENDLKSSEAVEYSGKQNLCPLTVLNISAVNNDSYEQSEDVRRCLKSKTSKI